MELNKEQVKTIAKWVREHGLEYPALFDDIVDHYCCIVEDKMNEGYSFDNAFKGSTILFSQYEMRTTQLFTLKYLKMEKHFSTRISLMATLPFLLLGIFWLFDGNTFGIPRFLVNFFIFGALISNYVLFVIGWVKDFPGWSLPSVGFCILFSIYMCQISIPCITKGMDFGPWAFAPFVVSLLIAIVIRPSLYPLKKLFKKIRDDKSLIIFIGFGFLPIMLMIICDEIPEKHILPIIVLLTLIMAAGSFYYLSSKKKLLRTLALTTTLVFAMGIALLTCFIYWG